MVIDCVDAALSDNLGCVFCGNDEFPVSIITEEVVAIPDDISDATTTEEIEMTEEERIKFEKEEERKAYQLFKETGIVSMKKGASAGKSYLEEMDEGNETGYDAQTRKDGLKYFHRVGHVTAETTDVPFVLPPTEQDVEDLMLLDALRCSMNINSELDLSQFKNIKTKLATVRKQGLDESAIFDNPQEYSTLDEYYNFLQDSLATSFVDGYEEYDEEEGNEEVVDMYANNMYYNGYGQLHPYYNSQYEEDEAHESTDWDDAYCNMLGMYPNPMQNIVSSDELVCIST